MSSLPLPGSHKRPVPQLLVGPPLGGLLGAVEVSYLEKVMVVGELKEVKVGWVPWLSK